MKTIAGLFLAPSFFALVAVISVSAAAISADELYTLIGLAFLWILYVCSGGFAWFGTQEHPNKVLGTEVRFVDVEHVISLPLPSAVIRELKDNAYRAVFTRPVMVEKALEHYVDLYARHQGHPILRARTWRGVAVNGITESGKRFIGIIRRA